MLLVVGVEVGGLRMDFEGFSFEEGVVMALEFAAVLVDDNTAVGASRTGTAETISVHLFFCWLLVFCLFAVVVKCPLGRQVG